MRRITLLFNVVLFLSLLVTNSASSSQAKVDSISNTGWHIEVVDSDGDVGRFTSLALDSSGKPHISYYANGYSASVLKYAYQDASGWHKETVDYEGGVGYDTSLALDARNRPHISYYDLNNRALKYAQWMGGDWDIQIVDDGRCGSTSLDLDNLDLPHISYYDRGSNELRYARWAGSWITQTVDRVGGLQIYSPMGGYEGGLTSLALDTWDRPHISYYDWNNYVLKYAYWTGNRWIIQTVDSTVSVSGYISLDVDENGDPHIGYSDRTNRNLKYAYRDASGWHKETVDSEGSVGWHISLKLNKNGYPHISYESGSNPNYVLKYTYQDASGWHTETVDSELSVGWYSSLDLDKNGYPHISYYDYAKEELKYAHPDPMITVRRGGEYGPIEINRHLCLGPILLYVKAEIESGFGLDWVRLYYRFGGSPESYAELLLSGEKEATFEYQLGPFDQTGTVSYYLRARNLRGEETRRPTAGYYTIDVNDCPGCTSWTTEFWPPDDGFKFMNLSAGGGQCVGMSATALDYFEFERPIPSGYDYWVEPPGSDPENLLSCYIQRRQLLVNVITAVYEAGRWLNTDNIALNMQEYEKIKSRIRDDHRPALVGLGPTNGHQIVVYAVTECTDGRVALLAYDSNKVLELTGAYPALVEGHFAGNGLQIDSTSTLGKGGRVYPAIFADFDAPLLPVPQDPVLGPGVSH